MCDAGRSRRDNVHDFVGKPGVRFLAGKGHIPDVYARREFLKSATESADAGEVKDVH